jgi:hypothetical protein
VEEVEEEERERKGREVLEGVRRRGREACRMEGGAKSGVVLYVVYVFSKGMKGCGS